LLRTIVKKNPYTRATLTKSPRYPNLKARRKGILRRKSEINKFSATYKSSIFFLTIWEENKINEDEEKYFEISFKVFSF
jgi:hypothetical protein